MSFSSVDSALHVLGCDLDRVDASALHDVGMGVDTNNGRAVYAKAAASTGVGSLVTIAPTSAAASVSVEATLVSTANVNSAAGFLAISKNSVAANSYSWFYTAGHKGVKVKVAAGCQPFVPLYTTATGGVVDDAVVSAGRVEGLRIITSASAASTPPGVFANLTRITQDIA